MAGFLVNFVRMARWELLDLEFRPTEADREKFRFLFPGRDGGADPGATTSGDPPEPLS